MMTHYEMTNFLSNNFDKIKSAGLNNTENITVVNDNIVKIGDVIVNSNGDFRLPIGIQLGNVGETISYITKMLSFLI